jgi:hypothetical protein
VDDVVEPSLAHDGLESRPFRPIPDKQNTQARDEWQCLLSRFDEHLDTMERTEAPRPHNDISVLETENPPNRRPVDLRMEKVQCRQSMA